MDLLKEKRAAIEEYLKNALPSQPQALARAMEYSLMAGGKRLRPLIVVITSEAYDKTCDSMPFACALEMIHTYSLIHDDLPAMDNDDLRRGKPTSHIVFGEAMAILAGDALLNRAYEIMAEAALNGLCGRACAALAEVARASGAERLIGGQATDILMENKPCDEQTLGYIHKNKTAALFEAAFAVGGLAAGQPDGEVMKLRELGEKTGLFFQIADDILDVTANAADIGKMTQKDIKRGKATYISVYGLKRAKEAKKELSEDILRCIAALLCDKTAIEALVDEIITC